MTILLDRCLDTDDLAVLNYQEHKKRGGGWEFEFFRRQFHRHQEWVQMRNPSEELIEKNDRS